MLRRRHSRYKQGESITPPPAGTLDSPSFSLSNVSGNAGAIGVTLDGVTGGAEYRVERSVGESDNWTPVFTGIAGQFVDKHRTPNTLYKYRAVSLKNGENGQSAYSAVSTWALPAADGEDFTGKKIYFDTLGDSITKGEDDQSRPHLYSLIGAQLTGMFPGATFVVNSHAQGGTGVGESGDYLSNPDGGPMALDFQSDADISILSIEYATNNYLPGVGGNTPAYAHTDTNGNFVTQEQAFENYKVSWRHLMQNVRAIGYDKIIIIAAGETKGPGTWYDGGLYTEFLENYQWQRDDFQSDLGADYFFARYVDWEIGARKEAAEPWLSNYRPGDGTHIDDAGQVRYAQIFLEAVIAAIRGAHYEQAALDWPVTAIHTDSATRAIWCDNPTDADDKEVAVDGGTIYHDFTNGIYIVPGTGPVAASDIKVRKKEVIGVNRPGEIITATTGIS